MEPVPRSRLMVKAQIAVSIVSKKTLMEYGFTVIVRKTRGDDIDAACGQLAGDVIDRTKRTAMKRKFGEGIDVKAVN